MSSESAKEKVEAAEPAPAPAAVTSEPVEESVVDDSKLKLPDVTMSAVDVKVDDGESCEFEVRAKLFIFFQSEVYGGETRENFWKERGTGPLKLLKSQDSGKIRCVMRQDKTGKVISNHLVSPTATLLENAGSDRSWMFVASDYSDGELKTLQYAIRLKDKATALEFKAQYEKARDHNRTIFDSEKAKNPEAASAAAAPPSCSVGSL